MPRPANDALLHPECMGDDTDIRRFYDVSSWPDASDELLENEWAAPHFFSAEGWQHFAPAFMLLALRCAGDGLAATQATVMNTRPDTDFAASKLALFDAAQLEVTERFVTEITRTDPWPP